MEPQDDRLAGLLTRIRAHAPANCIGTGAPESEITACEEQIGVVLPRSFRRLLAELGFVWWPEELYGLSPRIPPGVQLPRATMDERHEVEPPLAYHLVPFCPDGFGNHYCLDTSAMVEGECPVVFWNHELEEDQKPPLTHGSFTDWLEEAIEQQLKWEAENPPPKEQS